ncbi:hypothetical protein EG329_001496 [Mollisiaceae sp. DMI_Dod_QoI]|nr:hypothetical protein EG329_001496 [Helotiales sp. DMI_Dod_QoI]
MARTKWLDGLRGIAAAIVAFDHVFMSDVWYPFVSFWTEPPEGNRHLVQLPPIRILFSAQSMVTLFMVISGYAISIGLLKDQNSPQFSNRVSSAIVRRGFRIYLPVLVTASLAQFLYFFDLFNWKFEEDFLKTLPLPWTAPWAHITYVLSFMADVINIIAFRYPGSLNGQLWTMPMEFRGSNVVYLLIVGISAWRPKARLYTLPMIGAFFLWYGNWDIFGFIWGLWLAQRTVAASMASSENLNTQFEMAEFEDRATPLAIVSPALGLCCGKDRYSGLKLKNCITLSHIGIALTFIMGFYLLCLGLDGHLPPGYQFLIVFQPARWNNWDICHMCWKSIGSAMLVYAIGELPYLQRLLNVGPVQYLDIWTQMLQNVPPNVRLLAPCSRGYKYGSPFSTSDATPEQLRARLGHDLASVTTNIVSKLHLLSHPQSKLKLLCWSVGTMTLLSAYQLLWTSQLSSENEETLKIKVDEIIIFEGTPGLLMPPPASAFTEKYQRDLEILDPASSWIKSILQTTGIYHYDPMAFADTENGIPDEMTVYPINESLADDPAFMKIVTPLMDPAPLSYYFLAGTLKNGEGRAYLRESVKGMLSSGAEKVVVLCTRHCIPECLQASASLMDDFRLCGRDIGKEGKAKLRFVEGDHNHFVNVTAPEVLWKSLTL